MVEYFAGIIGIILGWIVFRQTVSLPGRGYHNSVHNAVFSAIFVGFATMIVTTIALTYIIGAFIAYAWVLGLVALLGMVFWVLSWINRYRLSHGKLPWE
jgi:uncharacterized Tic20 family protein